MFSRGLIVKANSGRDKGGFFVVLDTCENYVTLVNGKRRTLLKPKNKNRKHLTRTLTTLTNEVFSNDKSVRSAFNDFLKVKA